MRGITILYPEYTLRYINVHLIHNPPPRPAALVAQKWMDRGYGVAEGTAPRVRPGQGDKVQGALLYVLSFSAVASTDG